MPKSSAQVTAAEISRMAGVTRATVSNWRRRHEDFPAPTGGTDASPLYDLHAVRAWLKARGYASAAPSEELRAALRLHLGRGTIASRLLPLVLAGARLDKDACAKLDDLSDADLAARAQNAVNALSGTVPDTDGIRYTAQDADPLRALIHCVREEGPRAALDVLAERELEDSASTGTYRTPRPLADLMARLLQQPNAPYPARVLDPACGSGTLLAAALRHGATCLYGQDSLPVQAQRSAVRLLLAEPAGSTGPNRSNGSAGPGTEVAVRIGDSLRDDAFPGLTVDAVLCNPPYGNRDWGHDELAYDPRWAYGLPPRGESELAWVQHALSHLVPGGLAVMLLPPATASRASGRRIRAALLRDKALRAVIALPPGSAPPLHIGLHLWVLKRPNTDDQEPTAVLFVDTASERDSAPHSSRRAREAAPYGRMPADWEERVSAKVLTAWQSFTEDPAGFTAQPGTARAVPVIDLLDDLVDVTPSRHVSAAAPAIKPAVLASQVTELCKRLDAMVEALDRASDMGPWPPAGDQARTWRTATVADLKRGAALAVHRVIPTARRDKRASVPKEYAGLPVLTGRDVATGQRASGHLDDARLDSFVRIEAGDVLLPAVVGPNPANGARVADEEDAGCLLGANVELFRPDPERLDPWFLAGFLGAPDNVRGATTGSTSLRLDPGRLRVPLLPLAEQRRYGHAFRRLYKLRTAARQTGELATKTADTLAVGLTGGALLPPDGPPEGEST